MDYWLVYEAVMVLWYSAVWTVAVMLYAVAWKKEPWLTAAVTTFVVMVGFWSFVVWG